MIFYLRRAHILRCALFLSAFLFACNPAVNASDPPQENSASSTDAIRSRLAFEELSPAQRVRLATLPAEIIVPQDATWTLSTGATGRIEQWHVRIGDTLDVGQVIAEISNFEQSDYVGEIAQARAAVQQRQALLDSKESALQFGAATAEDVHTARANLEEARAQQRALERAQRTRNAARNDKQWRAPVAGVITDLHCAPGAVVTAADPCITLLDTTHAALRAYLPEALTHRIDDTVRGTWFPWGANAPIEAWEITRKAPTIDPKSRAQAVDFTSDAIASLRPGQSGRLELFAPANPTWFDVPRQAVTSLDGHDVLFVEHPEEPLPHAVPIAIITRQHDRIIIDAEALQPGTRFVSRGAFLLKSLAVAELGGGHEP